MKAEYFQNHFVIPIKEGDIILTGRFRNKPVRVKEVGIDEMGQPTVENFIFVILTFVQA